MAEGNSTPTKCCSKCGANKAIDQFAWHSKKDNRLRADCQECRSKSQAIHHSTNKDRINARKAAYRLENVEAYRLRSKEWYERNLEQARAKRAEWRAENLDRLRVATAKWRAEHPDRQKAAEANWRANNPETVRKNAMVRRGRLLKVGSKVSVGFIKKLMVLQRGRCACCGKSLKAGYHIDHIIPIALGGENADSNLQLLTPLCNLRKQAKHPIDYMQQKGFLL